MADERRRTGVAHVLERVRHHGGYLPPTNAIVQFLAGTAALASPAIMGVGYDTVDATLAGTLAWSVLAVILVAKIVASSACIGLGMPVGVIGPTLVIGAVSGGLLGHFGLLVSPTDASSQGFYVILGVAAMMAATLQAPLAALMTVVELTSNANIILPAMLIVILATLTAGRLFRQPSVFLATPSALRSPPYMEGERPSSPP